MTCAYKRATTDPDRAVGAIKIDPSRSNEGLSAYFNAASAAPEKAAPAKPSLRPESYPYLRSDECFGNLIHN